MSVFSFDSEYLFAPSDKSGAQLLEQYIPVEDEILRKKLADSAPIPGTEREGYSAVYRNAAFPRVLKSGISSDLNTYGKFFNSTVRSKPDNPCFASREYDYVQKKSADHYSTLTYSEVNTRKKNFGAGLLYLLSNSNFLEPAKYNSHQKIVDHVKNYGTYDKNNMSFILTVFAPNRMEWMLTDIMCCDYSITNSSLYDTLGPDVSKYILELTESPAIVLDKHNINTILNLKRQFPKALENLILLISMDPLDLEGKNESISFEDVSNVSAARELGITLIDLDRVEKVGEIFPHKELPSTPESTYTISFTSGTTGSKPKGVVLSHVTAGAGITFLHPTLAPPKNGKAFAFLPLAHIYERQNTAYAISLGSLIGFPQLGGTPLTLIEDLKLFKPNVLTNVPRVYTKFEAAIKSATIEHPTSLFTRSLFDKILNSKKELQSKQDHDPGYHFVYDKIFLSKIRAKFGFDDMVFSVCGSAPISVSTIKFLKAALNIGFSQGYGLTESFAGMSVTISFDSDPGSCGSCGITTEMKLKELPQMGYHANDEGGPRGELLLRGPQIFSHYFKNEEETSKAFDEEGWFHTGDVAKFDSRGRIYIIDRVKNFFKLAQGEYVTPEKVENAYLSANPILTQLYAHGDSLKHFLVGICGVDIPLARKFLKENCQIKIQEGTNEDEIVALINQKENRKLALAYVNEIVSREGKLSGFEKLHNLYFEIEPLRLDRDVITPTTKLKRPIARKFFGEQIDAMYKEGSLIDKNKL
ncbi:long-chain-fatty-acid--CoA ligase 2 [[Candida] railenensis]|uniref:Long-chain-fatty-acid--CoA ligase 2 n=1 Tax=[Candida] railenensis TaxID=45579 RepID=A0A9P0QSY2_9ASCO|nr:long-chain-fatty-acid--CoA ligase 2 [[Candida] railenensis]